MTNVLGRVLTIVAIATSLAACTDAQPGTSEPSETRRANRLMPPATLLCARNDLTSYTGLVMQYSRTPGMTSVVIHTDAEITEKVVVHHENALDAYLLNGAKFTADDWRKIESKEGILLPNMRVTAWVCLDGKTSPVLDWRPV